MHPIFSNNRALLVIVLLWALVCVLVIALYAEIIAQTDYVTVHHFTLAALVFPWVFIYLYFCAANYYLCQMFPLASSQIFSLIYSQLGALIATVLFWLLLGYAWSQTLVYMGVEEAYSVYRQTLVISGILGAVFYSGWIFIHYTYLLAKDEEEQSAAILQQKLLLSDIELQAVKATVHPHFMYNSLTMLASLSLTSPDKIYDICTQMSGFLRYSVNHAKNHFVTVEDEVTHIKNYLAIERERFGERLQIDIHVDEQAIRAKVLPLVLFPLVENSIKHGVSSQFNTAHIWISITVEGKRMTIAVKNTLDPEGVKRSGTQLGLATLEKRLKGYFAHQAKMRVVSGPEEFQVEVFLPLILDANDLSRDDGNAEDSHGEEV